MGKLGMGVANGPLIGRPGDAC